MRPLDTFAPDFEMAHSVEARRAARFALDFAPSVSGLAATACAATVGMIGVGSPGCAPIVPACIASHAGFVPAEVEAIMATLPKVDHD